MSATYYFYETKKKIYNSSIVQSAIDSLVKSLVSGVVVASISIFVIGYIEDAIERSEKRAALRNLTNTTILSTIDNFTTSIVELECLRNVGLILSDDCKSGLTDLEIKLSRDRNMLYALIPDKDFSVIDRMVDIIEEVQLLDEENFRTSAPILSKKFSETMRELIRDIADLYE